MEELKKYLNQTISSLLQKQEDHFELEVRLGKIAPEGFQTNIGQEQFDSLLNKLNKAYPDLISQQEFDEFKLKSKARLRIDAEGNVVEAIKKSRYSVQDFGLGGEYDVRVGVSKEIQIQEELKPKGLKIHKHRHQLSFDVYSLELTEVSFSTSGRTKSRYQAEIEVDLAKVDESSISRLVDELVESLLLLIN